MDRQQIKEMKRQEKLAKYAAKMEKQQKSQEGVKRDKNVCLKETEEPIEQVPEGEKKNMDLPMKAQYCPRDVENGWYAWWEKQGYFRPRGNGLKYVIPIPPPNITGSLHLGHAMATSLQDTLVRWKRMRGYRTVYIPGCDHAGISCQVVVEKSVMKTLGKTRHDLGREGFLDKVWEWKAEYGDYIYKQLRRLGGSMDWSRCRFTMDESMVDAVNEAFIRMYEEGIIYRGDRLINWCGKLQTSISDLEVDHLDVSGPTWMEVSGHGSGKKYEFGVIYRIKYMVEGEDEEGIEVMTTRPETIPGDVAIAVNPKDARYVKYHGKRCVNPISDKTIPIVLDESAEMEFGSGAVKITPAHDFKDYEVGKRHSLTMINIFDDENRLNEHGGKFQGLARFDARIEIVKYLEERGLLLGKEPHSLTLPICNRSGDIVEPRLREQWWMSCGDLAKQAMDCVRKGELKIVPEESEKIWFHWLENIKDWCLSRQLWWGHRVPMYRVVNKGQEQWIAAKSLNEARLKMKSMGLGSDSGDLMIEQDPDVLDTWFSSGLWPFAILGWPRETADMGEFYPNDVLETGKDILFFWVARMVMLGIHLTGRVPFHTVFLHPIVRDSQGRKMSKSLGNVVDPVDIIEGITLEQLNAKLHVGNLDKKEIEQATAGQKKEFPHGIKPCGTDALRFCLLTHIIPHTSNDINLDVSRIEGYRKFCNKLWNATRFVLSKLGSEPLSKDSTASVFDRWMMHRLDDAAQKINGELDEYNFYKATSTVYSYIYDMCNIYIEAIKPVFERGTTSQISSAQRTLYKALETGLRMLHPFMPFITEELYQRLPSAYNPSRPESISISAYPTGEGLEDPSAEHAMNMFLGIVETIRGQVKSVRGPFAVRIEGETQWSQEQLWGMASMVQGCRGVVQGSASIENLSISGNVARLEETVLGTKWTVAITGELASQ